MPRCTIARRSRSRCPGAAGSEHCLVIGLRRTRDDDGDAAQRRFAQCRIIGQGSAPERINGRIDMAEFELGLTQVVVQCTGMRSELCRMSQGCEGGAVFPTREVPTAEIVPALRCLRYYVRQFAWRRL